MTETPGSLTVSIRRKLHDGKTPDEIVQELVATGMTDVSARRFVDRVIAGDASAPRFSSETPSVDSFDQFAAEVEAGETAAGRKQLWVGAGLMCVGIAITGGTYVMANAGERYIGMWGIIVAGLLTWGQAVFRGLGDRSTFPWRTALASFALPALLAGAAYGFAAATEPEGEVDSAMQAQMDAIFDASKTPQPDPKAITITETPPPPGLPEVEQLFYTFDNTRSASLQCEMARRLGLSQSGDKTEALEGLIGRFGLASDEVKVCIKRAVEKLDAAKAESLKLPR